MTFIPRADSDFNTWQENSYNPAADILSAHPDTDPLIEALYAAHDNWFLMYGQAVEWTARLQAQIVRKNEARAAYEKVIRQVTRLIQTYPETTDAERATLGITIAARSGTGLRPVSSRENALQTRPVGRVDLSQRLKHTLRYSDESTPTRTAKPKGALGAEVRVGLSPTNGPIPADPESMRFLGLSTNGSLETEFPPEAAGKVAVYMLRWVGANGVTGPWSESVTATVAA